MPRKKINEPSTPAEVAAAVSRILPVGNRVVVKKAEPLEMTKGGILMPEMARGVHEYTVVAVGPQVRESSDPGMSMEGIEPGARVVLGEFANVGSKVRVDGEEFLIVKVDDILARLG